MRIAVDARELSGKPTGVGRYLATLLSEWAQLPAAAEHEFALCTTESVTRRDHGALHASILTAPGSGTSWEQRALPGLLRQWGADVLFAPAYSAPIFCPVPTVVAIHDVSFAAHPEWFSWREGLRRRLVTRLSARRAVRILTLSDFSKREIVKHLGVDAAKVDVTYLGMTALVGVRAGRRQGSSPVVLYVGSLFERRHIAELIDGFARVAARHPSTRLEIVGDHRARSPIDVTGRAAAAGVGNRVRERAYVSDAELSALYASADAFVFLSEYEGFGLTPLEALAAGVPVVVLDTEVAREVYGPAAIYVARPDPALVAGALERALFDETERARILSAAHRLIARYSWTECAQRTLQAILSSAHSSAR